MLDEMDDTTLQANVVISTPLIWPTFLFSDWLSTWWNDCFWNPTFEHQGPFCSPLTSSNFYWFTQTDEEEQNRADYYAWIQLFWLDSIWKLIHHVGNQPESKKLITGFPYTCPCCLHSNKACIIGRDNKTVYILLLVTTIPDSLSLPKSYKYLFLYHNYLFLLVPTDNLWCKA